MAGFLENNKIRIVLSNTESTRSNIFKYNSLTKNGEVRPSSTAGYFLATNPDTINEMIEFLNPDNDEFVVDVVKTRSYIEKMNQVVKMFSLSDFHDDLQDYFINRGVYFTDIENFSLGKPYVQVDSGNRLNIKFENDNENVKKFRGVVIALLGDIIIEKGENINIIYPVLKNGIIDKVKIDYLFSKNSQYWTYSPGKGGSYWDYCYDNNQMIIGWDDIGPLNYYNDRDHIAAALKEKYNEENAYNDISCIDDFIHKLHEGDIVIAKIGQSKLLGYGRVIDNKYLYNNNRERFKNTRNVNWIKKGVWEIPKNLRVAQKILTDITPYDDFAMKLINIMEGDSYNMKDKFRKWLENISIQESSITAYLSHVDLMSKESQEDGLLSKSLYEFDNYKELEEYIPIIINSEKFKTRSQNSNNINFAALNHYIEFLKNYYDKDLFLEEVFMNDSEYEKIYKLLMRKKNIILKGSPGVGKTFMARRLAYSIIGKKAKDQVLSVQFHQSYSYEDFIEGIRPNKDGEFVLTPGVFKEFVDVAKNNRDKDYFVIIDEINRGNLSKILGELMKLIEYDKRDKEDVILPYSKESFTIPENIFIIGTMNTADRSLAMVDYALRRRFAFIQVNPAFNNPKFSNWLIEKNNIKENDVNLLCNKMIALNAAIDDDLGEGFEIGHSYFVDNLDSNNFTQSYKDIIDYEIIPLLEEYWFDDDTKIVDYKQML